MPTVAPIPAFVNANIHHGSNDRCKHQSSNRNNQHILLANSIEELNHKVEDALSYNLKSNELLVAEHETKVAALQVKIDTLIQQNKALLAANDTLQDKLHFESFKN